MAASLTEWRALDYARGEPLQLHGVRHLSALTKLTKLTLKDNAAVGKALLEHSLVHELHGEPFPSLQSHKHPEADLVHGNGNSSDCEPELLYPADFLEL